MAIAPRRGWGRPRLTGAAGGVLPAGELEFALDLKQAGFDGAGTMKSPQEAYQPMNELKLDQCSSINAADERALRRISPSRQAGRRDRRRLLCGSTPGKVRDIVLDGLGVAPHRHWRSLSISVAVALMSSFLGVATRQRHAAELMPLVQTVVVLLRGSLSRACGQP
jgi:hypothetical protein